MTPSWVAGTASHATVDPVQEVARMTGEVARSAAIETAAWQAGPKRFLDRPHSHWLHNWYSLHTSYAAGQTGGT